MTYVNQFPDLIKRGVKKNKVFIKSLYEEKNFEDSRKFFDYLDCSRSYQRQTDEGMTLEKFLKFINKNSMITLQLASPEPKDIRYGVRLSDQDINRFLFIEMPCNENNFNLVSEIYKSSFGRVLEKEKVLDGILDYYLKRINNSFKF